MKKLLTFFLVTILSFNLNSFAGDLKRSINTEISNSTISRGAISISIKDAKSGEKVFELNPKMPVPPASIQKVITSIPAFITLGEDYKFTTQLYKNNNDEYLIKLGADPYLTTKDLAQLVKYLPKEIKQLYIDDSAIDSN
ncbi:D-alanyl-D-alanine carboxypeptidase, partial [bacterium]|nr:D-alanyl-D-alanine carboxypeptidase [bacterium]